MDNTDICLSFDDYDGIPVFTRDRKIPTLYPELTQEQRNKKYSQLITKKFKEYTAGFPPDKRQEYYEAVKMEVDTYKATWLVDYPLLNYRMVDLAVHKYGGHITHTGRGSAVGYLTNTLCGFSSVDRLQAPIKLYPERFISRERIIETNSLPDIDYNVDAQEPFEKAQMELLGQDHAVPMIAFGTLKKKAAFKLYARAQNLDFNIANRISGQIEQYDEAVKNADDEDERSNLNIYDFVDPQYHEYLDRSKPYWGIISDKKKAPSAYLLYSGSIRREIGLIKCKSESTKREYITTVIDGAVAENYKFLKNDILIISCLLLVDRIYERIGIAPHTVPELTQLVECNDRVWDIYADGLTMGVNQCEKSSTTKKVMAYRPRNISELSAFIAGISPGFKSMYARFECREPFSYGIPALDNAI